MTEEAMIRCNCGLIIAESKLKYHLEQEHLIKVTSDYFEEIKRKSKRKRKVATRGRWANE